LGGPQNASETAANKKFFLYREWNLIFQLLVQAAELMGKGWRDPALKYYLLYPSKELT
jgi:hypothetical protein